jgi:hypothetical protein
MRLPMLCHGFLGAVVLVIEHDEHDNLVLIPFYHPKFSLIDILQTMSIYVKNKSTSKA